MDKEQAILELEGIKQALYGICEMTFDAYKQKQAKAMTDVLSDKIAAIDIAIDAIKAIDSLAERRNGHGKVA